MNESQMLELMKRSLISLLIVTENALTCGGLRLRLEEDAEIALKRIAACRVELQQAQFEAFDDQTALLKEVMEDIVVLKARDSWMPANDITMEVEEDTISDEERAEMIRRLQGQAVADLEARQIAEEPKLEVEKDEETKEEGL